MQFYTESILGKKSQLNKFSKLKYIEYISKCEQELEKSLNKQALIELVHEKIGGTKVQAEEIVNAMFDAIVATLKKGGEVSIAGIGIFSVKARAARMARNPKTGEQVKVAATKVPKFRAAKALKDAVK